MCYMVYTLNHCIILYINFLGIGIAQIIKKVLDHGPFSA